MTRRQRLEAATGWLGIAAALGMFLVLVMGATVTDTGSAQGCGHSWPLCQGRFVPEFAVATLIEWSHRTVSGVEGMLIVVLAGLALYLYGRERPAQVLVTLMLLGLFLQAGLGAAAVMWPQQAAVLALHFGVSLVALASATLTALYVGWHRSMRGLPRLPAGVAAATWGLLAYLYLLVYSGAYIRHAAAAAACPSWPLCGSAQYQPGLALAANYGHRAAAALAVVLTIGLALLYRSRAPRRHDLIYGSLVVVAALLAQAAAGAFLVASGFGLFGELLHAALSGVAFTAASFLALRAALSGRLTEVP